MGALVYEPDIGVRAAGTAPGLDLLAAEAERILAGGEGEVLDALAAAASPGGAQPKTLVAVDGAGGGLAHPARDMPPGHAAWMVKFPTLRDRFGMDAGAMEYAYSLMAAEAGLEMAETRLFGTELGHPGYFGTALFDRGPGLRRHLHSACGLLHSPFEMPALDYEDLVKLAHGLTRDIREVGKLYRIAVFNVLAHNRDDHSKNFAFLMDGRGRWRLAPAYDLTYTEGPNGEHKTTVSGTGRNPGRRDLERLGAMAGLDAGAVSEAIGRTREAVSRWPETAGECGVGPRTVKVVSEGLDAVWKGFDG